MPPGAGEHRHTLFNNHVHCHDDHTTANTCDPGEHLNGHDTCHEDHTAANTCDPGQHLHGHDTCDDDHTAANTCDPGQHLHGHDTCDDDHTCPADQFMAPFPNVRALKRPGNPGRTLFSYSFGSPDPDSAYESVPAEWVTLDTHTGCSQPKHPDARNPCGTRIPPVTAGGRTNDISWSCTGPATHNEGYGVAWGDLLQWIKDAAEAVFVTEPDFVIDRASTYALAVNPTNYTAAYFVVCVPEGELARRLAEIEAS